MDFSSQLANLQKSASAAQQGGNNSTHPNRDNRGSPSRNGQGNRPNFNSDRRRPPPRHGDNRRHNNNQNNQNNYYGREPPNKRQRRDHVEGPYRSPKWNNLKRAVDTLPKFQPKEEATPSPCSHLCLLAITINELPLEAIWRDWAERQNISISLICHAKEPNKVQSEWLKQRLLVNAPHAGRGNDFAAPTYHTRYPAWGSIEITRAMLDLSHESCKVGTDADMKDPRFSTNRYAISNKTDSTPLPKVDKVLFISETCLPIASLSEDMLSSSVSIVNARDTPNNGFSRQLQFEKIHSLVPKKFKADQWMMLSRTHLDAILQMLPPNFWECFVDCNASDELYFPTALALLGIVVADDTDQIVVRKKRITYADWSMGPKNPATFEASDLKKVVAEARNEDCMVARKFGVIELEAWKAVVFPS